MDGGRSFPFPRIRKEIRKPGNISRSLFPPLVKKALREAKKRGLTLKVMFEDEGRFGRISDPSSCWAPKGMRPVVHKQMVREYTYAYAAVDPKEGEVDSLILPNMYATTMSVFLQELSQRHPDRYILLVMDGAPCHRAGDLEIPENIRIAELPPYSPELNPAEHLWDEMREQDFRNVTFTSMEKVEQTLVRSLQSIEKNVEGMKSLTGFPWILKALCA